MRVDKNTGEPYEDFLDWLRADAHALWLISLVFAYLAYLLTTEER